MDDREIHLTAPVVVSFDSETGEFVGMRVDLSTVAVLGTPDVAVWDVDNGFGWEEA